MTHHIGLLDYVMATTRSEWHYIHEEEEWEARERMPAEVHRTYFRRDVFRRDLARMTEIGFRVSLTSAGEPPEALQVVYRLAPGSAEG